MGLYREPYYDVLYDASAGMPCTAEVATSGKSLRVRGFVLDEIDEYRTESSNENSGIAPQKGVHDLISTVLNFKSVKSRQSQNSPHSKRSAKSSQQDIGTRTCPDSKPILLLSDSTP